MSEKFSVYWWYTLPFLDVQIYLDILVNLVNLVILANLVKLASLSILVILENILLWRCHCQCHKWDAISTCRLDPFDGSSEKKTGFTGLTNGLWFKTSIRYLFEWPVLLLFDFLWDGRWRSICHRQWGGLKRRRRRRRSTGSHQSACTESPEDKGIIFWLFLCCLSTCHVLAEGPIVGEDVDEGEGHGEGAEEDVRHRQGCNEYVSRCQHHLSSASFYVQSYYRWIAYYRPQQKLFTHNAKPGSQ